MPFQISEITSDHDFKELVEVEFSSFDNPPNPFRKLFYPIHGTGPEARKLAIEETTARILQNHKSNPASCWVKIADEKDGRLIGAALWMFFDEDPYTNAPLPEVSWWPEGEGREFTTIWWRELMKPRIKYMSQRHAYLNLCFVHPSYRRRGGGSQLLEWGVNKADEKQMVSYIDASAAGRSLYEHFGFVAEPEVKINFTKENPGELWKRLEKDSLPHVFWPMIRAASTL